jgi:hypothetical protein
MKKAVVFVAVALGVAACASLLGLRRENGPNGFEHRAHVLEGISCVDCHRDIDRAGEEGPLHLPDSASCLQCHEEPHDTSPCLGCHGFPSTQRRAADNRRFLRFSHEEHAPELHGNCARCHLDIATEDVRIGAPMSACLNCHAHEGEFVQRECTACHLDLPDEAVAPEDHIVHGEDFIERHASMAGSTPDLCATCHSESFCASCHGNRVPALASRLRFEDPWSASVHRGNFVSRHAEEARVDPGLCTSCHSESSCAGCHERSGVGARTRGGFNPHPPNWVGLPGTGNAHGPAARRDPASCASCHGGAGEVLCVRCHEVGGIGGNPHPPGFDSSRSLAELPCRLCHTSGP